MKEQYDEKKGYCRMLGHTLSFSYCRAMRAGLPCHNILNCWFERFDIETFIAENYCKEELQDIFKPPKMKIATMLEVIDRVTGTGIDGTADSTKRGDGNEGQTD